MQSEHIGRIWSHLKEINRDVFGDYKIDRFTTKSYENAMIARQSGGPQQRATGAKEWDHSILRQHEGICIGGLQSLERCLAKYQGKWPVMTICLKPANRSRNVANHFMTQLVMIVGSAVLNVYPCAQS